MVSVSAYYDGSAYVVQEDVAVKPNQKVIITLLDEFMPQRKKRTLEEIRSYMKGGKSVPVGISTVEYVRSLRAE